MNISDQKLKEFEAALREIREAANHEAGIFHDKDLRKTFIWLSLGFSIVIVAFCIAGHFLISESGTSGTSSAGIIFWTFAIMLAVGAAIKITLLSRIMGRKNKSIASLLRVIYGKGPASVIIAALLAVVVICVFLVTEGLGPLAVSMSAIFAAFAVFALDIRIQLPEFSALGWTLLALGLVSLFFIQGSPWLWGGIVWGGAFVSLGIAGIVASRAS